MTDKQMQKHRQYRKYFQKMYRKKKKQELQNIKKEQGNFDKNVDLTPPKTKIKSWLYLNIICILLLICISTFYLCTRLHISRIHLIISLFNISFKLS